MFENEIELRLGIFFGMLIAIMLFEKLRPKRILKIARNTRWIRNLLLVALNSIAVRILLPFTAASVAVYAEQNHIGILYYLSDYIPPIVVLVISVILLDLLIYIQHVVFHYVPELWSLHKVHHIDQEIDVTTGLRFHPVEIILSTLLKCTAVLALGTPFIAVLVFEILLNATAMFNHGNIRLPSKFDKWIRLVIVTPDMHRVHHSVIRNETNSNFGFNLPWWDRLFGTYHAQPIKGHLNMEIGLEEYRDVDRSGLLKLLIIPFKRK